MSDLTEVQDRKEAVVDEIRRASEGLEGLRQHLELVNKLEHNRAELEARYLRRVVDLDSETLAHVLTTAFASANNSKTTLYTPLLSRSAGGLSCEF